MNKQNKGFTLIEILVVIGIIAILAAVVLIAINPARQFAQANNSQRSSNVNTILNAVGQKLADNKGVFTTVTCPSMAANMVVDTVYNIKSTVAVGNINLSCLTPTYIAAGLPFDPTASDAYWTALADYDTGYTIVVDGNGRYTVAAPTTQVPPASAAISVSR